MVTYKDKVTSAYEAGDRSWTAESLWNPNLTNVVLIHFVITLPKPRDVTRFLTLSFPEERAFPVREISLPTSYMGNPPEGMFSSFDLPDKGWMYWCEGLPFIYAPDDFVGDVR